MAHAQVIVGAPDGDIAHIVGFIAIDGARKLPGHALKIGKDAVAFLCPQRVHRIFEYAAIVHRNVLCVLPLAHGAVPLNKP
ncbi:hypothetical protein D3C87_1923950 [compost metagenome]